jgi:lipid II:glycine glycyltransferase (peptidoglycan interpeptide bridge formation enzyme)
MRVDLQIPASEWDHFVDAHPSGHVLQTSAWGALKSEYGWSAEWVGVRDESRAQAGTLVTIGRDRGTLVAGALVLYRRLPLGFHLAYVPKGPIVDWADDRALTCLIAALHRRCRSRRAIMLKLEPDLWDDASLVPWTSAGFVPSPQCIQPRRTIVVDLLADEDAILKRMKSKTRYNIRLSERKGVQVHEGGADEVAEFTGLMAVTSERNAFGVHVPDYYECAYTHHRRLDAVRLFLASVEDPPGLGRRQAIAGIMVFTCGQKAWYMYGASGNQHRNKMPAYALQWAGMRWAKARGCVSYDLYGIPDESEETLEAEFGERHDGLWGVYRFKRGFGGQVKRSIGALDYVYDKPLYWLYNRVLAMRR